MEETAAQRRRRRARAAVTRVAVGLFAEHGYAATSTEQVAAAADLSRSTLFRYFGDKEDLLFGLEDDLLAAVPQAVLATPPDTAPWPALRSAALVIAADVAALRDVLVAREEVIAGTPALQARGAAKHRRWESAIAGALAEHHALAPADAAMLAKLAVACFEVAQQRWLSGEGADLPRLLDEEFDRLAALVRPAG